MGFSPFGLDYDDGSDFDSRTGYETPKQELVEQTIPERQRKHHSHHDQQVQQQNNTTESVDDVFLSILRTVAAQDRQVLLELVDSMKQITKPEQCAAMLRGFNMGVCVGVRFANCIQASTSPSSSSSSSPDEGSGSSSASSNNDYNSSSSSSDSPPNELINENNGDNSDGMF